MVGLGYNYRLTDLQCALGKSQLSKLPGWVARRQTIARSYDVAFTDVPEVMPLRVRDHVLHAYHLYVIRLELDHLRVDRAAVFAALRAEGIGVNVHYIPVHLHPFYRERFGTGPGLCPISEAAYAGILSLPMFPGMSDADVGDVISAVHKVIEAYRE
jgi:perosamine synthetase